MPKSRPDRESQVHRPDTRVTYLLFQLAFGATFTYLIVVHFFVQSADTDGVFSQRLRHVGRVSGGIEGGRRAFQLYPQQVVLSARTCHEVSQLATTAQQLTHLDAVCGDNAAR